MFEGTPTRAPRMQRLGTRLIDLWQWKLPLTIALYLTFSILAVTLVGPANLNDSFVTLVGMIASGSLALGFYGWAMLETPWVRLSAVWVRRIMGFLVAFIVIFIDWNEFGEFAWTFLPALIVGPGIAFWRADHVEQRERAKQEQSLRELLEMIRAHIAAMKVELPAPEKPRRTAWRFWR